MVTPRALSEKVGGGPSTTFAHGSVSRSCGYDGVEIMGSEGYLINGACRAHEFEEIDGESFGSRSV